MERGTASPPLVDTAKTGVRAVVDVGEVAKLLKASAALSSVLDRLMGGVSTEDVVDDADEADPPPDRRGGVSSIASDAAAAAAAAELFGVC